MFIDYIFRGDVKKVEIVMKEFKGNGIKVIVIGLGCESDWKELVGVVLNWCYVILVKRIDSLEELVKEVIVFGLEGMYCLVWLEVY